MIYNSAVIAVLLFFLLLLVLALPTDKRSTTNFYVKNSQSLNTTNANINTTTTTRETHISCAQCGLENRHRIVGGRDALATEFPWLAVIKYWHLRYCSGSVINDRYVLTAAHCVERKFVQLFTIVMYENSIMDSIQEVSFKVERVILHPQFDPDTFDYDVALLRLKQSVKFGLFLRPVCLPNSNQDEYVGLNATVVGWGSSTEDSEEFEEEFTEDKLHKLEIPVVSNAECKASAGLKPYLISNRMLCAGYLMGGKDACQGDSGGPLLIHQSGRWIQIGIVSWGVGCARPDYYGVYTRLTQFVGWIEDNLDKHWAC